MNFIKKHKVLVIIISIILVTLLFLFILLKAFIPSGNEYGNRLKGIDKVVISSKDINKWEQIIKKREKIKEVSINVQGRLINILIKVEEDTNIDDIKDYSKEKLEIFDENELNYYDIQFYIINEKDNIEHYPSIGYVHKGKNEIFWSNN